MQPTPHILVVDDEPNIRLTLDEALEGDGFAVDTAESAREALGRLAEGEYALVLLDLRMPGMNGLEALREIQRLRPEVPVVLMSAYGTIDATVEAMKGGAVHVIQKPFSPAEIRRLVERVIDREARVETTAASYDDHLRAAAAGIRAGRLKAAAEHARRAAALDPDRPEAHNVLGVTLQLRGLRAEAVEAYHVALARAAGYPPALHNLENLTGVEGLPQPGRYDLGEERPPAPRRPQGS